MPTPNFCPHGCTLKHGKPAYHQEERCPKRKKPSQAGTNFIRIRLLMRKETGGENDEPMQSAAQEDQVNAHEDIIHNGQLALNALRPQPVSTPISADAGSLTSASSAAFLGPITPGLEDNDMITPGLEDDDMADEETEEDRGHEGNKSRSTTPPMGDGIERDGNTPAVESDTGDEGNDQTNVPSWSQNREMEEEWELIEDKTKRTAAFDPTMRRFKRNLYKLGVTTGCYGFLYLRRYLPY